METTTAKGKKVGLGPKATKKQKLEFEKQQKGNNPSTKEKAKKEKGSTNKPEREKNKYGFVKGTRKDLYCSLLEQNKYSKAEMIAQATAKFGHASENAFQFFLRDLKQKGYKVQRRVLLSLDDSKPQ